MEAIILAIVDLPLKFNIFTHRAGVSNVLGLQQMQGNGGIVPHEPNRWITTSFAPQSVIDTRSIGTPFRGGTDPR